MTCPHALVTFPKSKQLWNWRVLHNSRGRKDRPEVTWSYLQFSLFLLLWIFAAEILKCLVIGFSWVLHINTVDVPGPLPKIRKFLNFTTYLALWFQGWWGGEWDSKTGPWGNSLAVQWLGLHTSTAGGTGSIPGQGTKIPKAAWPKK